MVTAEDVDMSGCGCNRTVLKGDKGDQGIQGIQGPEGSFGYKIYVFSIKQSGSSIPTIDEYANTLSATPTLSMTGTGTYVLTLTGEFHDKNKIHCNCYTFDLTRGAVLYIFNEASGLAIGFVKLYWIDANSLGINSYNLAGVATDLSTTLGTNSRLIFPEIRIYP